MEMKDLAFTYDETAMPTSPEKNKKHYPSLRLEKTIPAELMTKEVGDECELVIRAKIVTKSIRDEGKGKREELVLDVMKMGYAGKGNFQSTYDKAKELSRQATRGELNAG